MTTTPDANPKAAAKAAKAYAKASRPWFKKKRYIALLVIGLLVIISAISSGGGDSSDDNGNDSATTSTDTGSEKKAETKAEEKKAEKPAVKTVKVTATDLIKAFEDNEFAADQRYKGKTLEITGVVNKVETEVFDGDSYYLQLGGGGDFELLTVNCHDISKSALAKVSTGQQVTAIGKFDDGGSLGVEVKDCKLT